MTQGIQLAGTVTPPADMDAAARASLSSTGYADLMNQTGGAPPSPAQLCAAVALERSQQPLIAEHGRNGVLAMMLDSASMSAAGAHTSA